MTTLSVVIDNSKTADIIGVQTYVTHPMLDLELAQNIPDFNVTPVLPLVQVAPINPYNTQNGLTFGNTQNGLSFGNYDDDNDDYRDRNCCCNCIKLFFAIIAIIAIVCVFIALSGLLISMTVYGKSQISSIFLIILVCSLVVALPGIMYLRCVWL